VSAHRAPLAGEIAWTSSDPHLSGNFAPVGPEVDAPNLPVVSGRIPPELRGAYLRNGPNPLFQPLSYTYPMDGDGMVHAVHLQDSRARYRNRFVRTRGLEVELRAGHAVYGGLLRPRLVAPELVGADGDPGPVKSGAFINVIEHAGHILALGEAQPAYELTPELDTVGEWKAGTGLPIEMGAHNRRHPVTGDLFAIAYSAFEPVVRVHQIDEGGTLRQSFEVALAAPSMIHDFGLTAHHLVLVVGPAVFDAAAASEGQSFLQWRPELGARIGLIPLDGGPATWLETDAFFVFHIANAFERDGAVVVDYVRHDSFRPGYVTGRRHPPTLHRLVADSLGRTLRDNAVADFLTEFPRINEARSAMPARFVYAPTLTASQRDANPPSATFNALVRVDTETGATLTYDAGDRVLGEPAFIPRPGGTREDDGYLATYAFDPAVGVSDLLLLDAARVEAGPVAVIRLPQRVPQGLHGNWISRS
jgi:carotenoid cleavage dioxygenase